MYIAYIVHAPSQGVQSALGFRPACMQEGLPIFTDNIQEHTSEDCLFLNIWTPTVPRAGGVGSLPVLYFIHGGGLRFGSANLDLNNFAASLNAVVVTVGYRLGPLGFLVTTNQSSGTVGEGGTGGMNGYNDMIVGLQWVQEHVAAFGGDPELVTVMGESAGSVAACTLAVSPRAAGLFQAVIMESGACTGALWTIQTAQIGREVAQVFLNDHNATSVLDLQDIPATNFHWDQVANQTFYDYMAKATAYVDGWVMPTLPRELYEAGKVNVKRAIAGANSMDSLLILSMRFASHLNILPTDAISYAEDVAYHFGDLLVEESGEPDLDPNYMVSQVLSLYDPLDFANPMTALWQADSDAGVVCPMRDLANLMARAGVEVYHFAFQYGSVSNDMATLYGLSPAIEDGKSSQWASHGSELQFIFHNPCENGVCLESDNAGRFPKYANLLSATMNHAWGSFIRDPANAPTLSDGTSWPTIDSTQNVSTMIFDAPTVEVMKGYREQKCDFWSSSLG